jgi:hypothetical protein
MCGIRVVQIQIPYGLCDGRELRRRCEGGAQSAASPRGPLSVGQVHAESMLVDEFAEGVARRLYLDNLAASCEHCCDSILG